MKLIKCKKCGTPIASNDLMIQRLLDGMEEANNKSLRARTPAQRNIYIQQASQYKQLIKSITHTTTQLEERHRYLNAELKDLVRHLADNGIMTYDEIGLIQNKAREKAQKRMDEDKKKLNKLYQDGYNELSNNSKSDTTYNKVVRMSRQNKTIK